MLISREMWAVEVSMDSVDAVEDTNIDHTHLRQFLAILN